MTSVRGALIGSLALVAAVGCGRADEPRPAPGEVETVEVGPALDASLTTAGDAQAKPRPAGFSGILPGDFPSDIPTYRPATLADFGDAGGGRRYVLFQTPDSMARAAPAYRAALKGRGWSGAGESYSKGGRSIAVAFEDARPGTRIRLEYTP